jgi:pimeloyl-ACP methyl ester carboxylesterase
MTRPLAFFALGFVLLTGLLLGPLASPAQAQYTIVAANTAPAAGPLVRSEWLVQEGADPLDTFTMIRLARDVPPAQLRGSILFLPSLGTPFALYEQRDGSGGVGTSIAEFFALRGYDVYGYTPRYQNLSSGLCETGAVDCSTAAGWNLQSLIDDISFIRSQIEVLHPGSAVVAGGTSMGGILAFALADAHPADYVGIFPWEGLLFSPDPVVQSLNQGYCTDVEALLTAGIFLDPVGGPLFKRFVTNAALAPQGLNTIPLFPPFLTRHQLMVSLLSLPAPGPVNMPVPNYILMAGDVAGDRLLFADEQRLFTNVRMFADYVPNALVRDISCSLGGVETAYTDNLGAFTGSVLAIGGGRGFGPYMQGNLDQMTSADTTLLLEPEFGHIDHFMTPRHRQFVELPILHWLQGLMP